MEQKIEIKEKTITKIYVIDTICIDVRNVVLGTSADICVRLYSGETYRECMAFTITGTEYSGWGNNDEYIKNLVIARINTTFPDSPVVPAA